MPYARPDALVSTEWLATHMNAPDVRIVDGSFFLPAQKRDPKAEFATQHIPGAVFFDIDEIADTSSPLPHMLPSPEKFSSRVRKLGLGDPVVLFPEGTSNDGNRVLEFRSALVGSVHHALGESMHHDEVVVQPPHDADAPKNP